MIRWLPLILLLGLTGCTTFLEPNVLSDSPEITVKVQRAYYSDLMQQRLKLAPEFAQSLPLMGFTMAHQQGYTGEGANVMIIDFFGGRTFWGPQHGWAVMETMMKVAPDAEYFFIDLDVIIAELRQNFSGILDPVLRALQRTMTMSTQQKWAVVNMSIGYVRSSERCSTGTKYDSSINTTIRNLWKRDVNLVTSSGNSAKFTPGYPACVPQILSVGAIYDENLPKVEWSASEDRDFEGCVDEPAVKNGIACFSHRGEIYAVGAFADGYEQYTGGQPFTGTSLASPFVAGAMTLLRASGLSASEAQERMLDTATIGTHGNTLFKILDVAAALGLKSSEELPSQPKPPSDDDSDLMEVVDTNNNGFVDTSEFQAALDAWIQGQPLNGHRLTDGEMERIVIAWITGEPA